MTTATTQPTPTTATINIGLAIGDRDAAITEARALDAILDNYGGYTQTLVTGVWRNEDGYIFNDDSLKYEIAMDTGVGAGKKLVEIAAQACRDADQQCVMIQVAAGRVSFVKQNGEMS